jgi:hypothetical protein
MEAAATRKEMRREALTRASLISSRGSTNCRSGLESGKGADGTDLVVVRRGDKDQGAVFGDLVGAPRPDFAEEEVDDPFPEEDGAVVGQVGGQDVSLVQERGHGVHYQIGGRAQQPLEPDADRMVGWQEGQ